MPPSTRRVAPSRQPSLILFSLGLMRRAVFFATFGFALTVCASPWLEIQSEQAACVGIDYRHAYKRAYAGGADGLATMFRVTPALDGGGAEGHSHDLQKLLTVYGDARFAALLRRQSAAVRQSVIDSLDFAFELYVRRPDWSAPFPVTYRIAPHRFAHVPKKA